MKSSTRAASALLAGTFAVLLAGCGDDDGLPPVVVAPKVQTQATCAALASTPLPASALGAPSSGATVTSATYVVAVADALNPAGTAVIQGTPDYCRVLVDVKPVDATAPLVKVQVNLPTSWNGKSMQYGGGGFNGTLVTGLSGANNAPPDAPLPITRGYMTLGTDSGHQVAAGVEPQAFALNDEALTNFAYAAYKKTHDVGVQLAQAYYGRLQTRSYFVGQSEGGREGMTMAQRYPADFDAILSVDPVRGLFTL